MDFKKRGFSLAESILILIIIGVVAILMVPTMIKQKRIVALQDKIRCVQGERHVVTNSTTAGINGGGAETGSIALPPGIDEFTLTLAGGGGGGRAAYYQEADSNWGLQNGPGNVAGCAGNGANYIYNAYVKILTATAPANTKYYSVCYSIGAGGRGGQDSFFGRSDNVYMGAAGHAEVANKGSGAGASGQDSTLTIRAGDCSTGTPVSFTITNTDGVGTTTIKQVTATKGYAQTSAGMLYEGTDYRSRFAFHLLNIDVTYVTAPQPSAQPKSSYTFQGERGEGGFAGYPGLGGGSVLGYGSFGSGGAGGLEAQERHTNIKRGALRGFRRSGEDGLGGIMILEFDSKCQIEKTTNAI